MRKSLQKAQDVNVKLVNDFGKQKLILYADSFRNLAKTYNSVDKEYKEDESRQDYIMKRRLYENREVLAEHINELADILHTVAEKQ